MPAGWLAACLQCSCNAHLAFRSHREFARGCLLCSRNTLAPGSARPREQATPSTELTTFLCCCAGVPLHAFLDRGQ